MLEHKFKVGDYVKCTDGYYSGDAVFRIVKLGPLSSHYQCMAWFTREEGCFVRRLRPATELEILEAVLSGTVNTKFEQGDDCWDDWD